jgi:hypothetical protein
VAALLVLGHNALEVAVRGELEQALAVAFNVIDKHQECCVQLDQHGADSGGC